MNRKEFDMKNITWNNTSVSSMETTHIVNTMKQIHSWANDRRDGYNSKLYNGFTIGQTAEAMTKELQKRMYKHLSGK